GLGARALPNRAPDGPGCSGDGFGELEDRGLRGAQEGGGIGAGGPDRGLQEAEERRSVVGAVEVEVDDHVVGVANRPLDALLAYPGLLTGLREAAERGVPRVEV